VLTVETADKQTYTLTVGKQAKQAQQHEDKESTAELTSDDGNRVRRRERPRLIGLERDPAHRHVHDLAIDDLAVGAGEFGKAFLAGAFVPAQDAVIHQALVEEQDQLLGGAFALGGRTDERHAEAIAVAAHHGTFEAAEAVDIEHKGGAGLGNGLTGQSRAARRQVQDRATRLAGIGGNEKPARKVHFDPAEAAPFGTGFPGGRVGILLGHCQALHRPAPNV